MGAIPFQQNRLTSPRLSAENARKGKCSGAPPGAASGNLSPPIERGGILHRIRLKLPPQSADKQSVGVYAQAPPTAPPLWWAIGRIQLRHERKARSAEVHAASAPPVSQGSSGLAVRAGKVVGPRSMPHHRTRVSEPKQVGDFSTLAQVPGSNCRYAKRGSLCPSIPRWPPLIRGYRQNSV